MVQLSANVLNAGRDMVPWYKVPACRAARRSAATSDTVESLLNVGRDMLPKNIIKASAESSYLGIMVFLCAARAAPGRPAGQPACPDFRSGSALHCNGVPAHAPTGTQYTHTTGLAGARPARSCLHVAMHDLVAYGCIRACMSDN